MGHPSVVSTGLMETQRLSTVIGNGCPGIHIERIWFFECAILLRRELKTMLAGDLFSVERRKGYSDGEPTFPAATQRVVFWSGGAGTTFTPPISCEAQTTHRGLGPLVSSWRTRKDGRGTMMVVHFRQSDWCIEPMTESGQGAPLKFMPTVVRPTTPKPSLHCEQFSEFCPVYF
jgi:hypothetical protein